MAPEIATNYLKTDPRPSPLRVLDPMCGSGTVLTAASAQGHYVQGFDMDPLAVLMSSVATARIMTNSLVAAAEKVVHDAKDDQTAVPLWTDRETSEFAEYWFGAKQRRELTALSRAIGKVDLTTERQALQVALSRIIITKSAKASLASDTAHSRPHRVQTESCFDVFAGFEASVLELSRILSRRTLNGRSAVSLGDARTLGVAAGSIDLIITSPPYLNAIDYMRGHKMSLIWLGYSIPTLRTIRATSVGTSKGLHFLDDERVNDMVRKVQSKATNSRLLPLGVIRRYAQDLCHLADEMSRVLKPGGQAVLVVGNSTIRGNYIENDRLVANALSAAGLKITDRQERELPDNLRYLPMKASGIDSSLAKRMRAEVVLTGAKALSMSDDG